MLRAVGIPNAALHSGLSQNDRLGSLAKFKSRVVDVLLATDVGSRYSSATRGGCGSRRRVLTAPGGVLWPLHAAQWSGHPHGGRRDQL